MSRTEMLIETIRETNYIWCDECRAQAGEFGDLYQDVSIHEFRRDNTRWQHRYSEYYDVYLEDYPVVSESDFSDWKSMSEDSVIDHIVALITENIIWQSHEEFQEKMHDMVYTKPYRN